MTINKAKIVEYESRPTPHLARHPIPGPAVVMSMEQDELTRLRKALAHAHDENTSPIRQFLKKITEPLREVIQKRAIVQRAEIQKKKKDAA